MNVIIVIIFIFLVIGVFFVKFNTNNMWFYLTLLFMVVIFVSGLFVFHFMVEGNFISNLGILLSVVLFSIPVAMYHLKCLYEKNL